jgi:2',3'-cyclic-nucleotide 2'-phosphodiesterase (5'-nucleotidase family)
MNKLIVGVLLLINVVVSHRVISESFRLQRESLNEETFVIIATNDIHGAAYSTQLIRSDTKEKYTYGGLATMAGIIDIIKN